MKVRPLTQANFEEENHKTHSDKHYKEYLKDNRFKGIEYPSAEFNTLYNEIGRNLSKTRVDKSDSSTRIVGYIAKDSRQIKYDKATKDYLVISSDGSTVISLHKRSGKEYTRVLKKDFLKEFDYNEN